ncbi:MAG: hypothetical protein IKD59_01105 [Lachnospiraceae bacterium]|nr:hypothetical protein [Lachnospiraceae bacterium]
MIVAVIRHARVDMKWKFMMTSAGYDKGCADYDTADVMPVSVNLPEADFDRIYVSALPRTTATASSATGPGRSRASTASTSTGA